jgi:hypothetical protein
MRDVRWECRAAGSSVVNHCADDQRKVTLTAYVRWRCSEFSPTMQHDVRSAVANVCECAVASQRSFVIVPGLSRLYLRWLSLPPLKACRELPHGVPLLKSLHVLQCNQSYYAVA